MSAEIIAIGSELTCGARLDTNSQWLSRQLESLGWNVTRHTTLSDSVDVLASEFRAAASRSRIVLITGGLGPTLDDITRDAMAEAFAQPLVRDPESMGQIEALFAARGRPMPERNRRQADRPRDAEAIPNSCGTAPGILMRVTGDDGDASVLAAMPGVPTEMRQMFLTSIQSGLLTSGTVVERVQIRTFGMGESEVEQHLGDLTRRGQNPEVGITASEAVITLSVTARGESAQKCREMIEPLHGQILSRLGSAVFATGEQDLHECVSAELQRRRCRIVCLEGAVTGGLIAHWLCDHPRYEEFLVDARVRSREQASRHSVGRTEPETDWESLFRSEAGEILNSGQADFVLMTSGKWDGRSDQGVAMRHGFVAVAGENVFEMRDVSMTGNLAIFRARAARTALNCLRLAALR